MRATLFILLVATAVACSQEKAMEADGYKVSSKNDLQWKRYAAIENDLVQALALEGDTLCQELGSANCGQVHLVPLGGNDPFQSGLLQPSAEPLATTSSVIDRVLLNACGQRVARDRDAGMDGAVVFHDFDLAGDAPEATDAAVEATIVDLYRRFLARDPEAHEVEIVSSLVEDENGTRIAATDFAVAACFAIGSTTEFLFF